MMSSDHEILIAINGQLQVLGEKVARVEETTAIIRRDIDILDRRISRVEDKVDMLQNSVYWGFAVVSLVVVFVGIFAPMIFARRDNPPAPVNPPQFIMMPPYVYPKQEDTKS